MVSEPSSSENMPVKTSESDSSSLMRVIRLQEAEILTLSGIIDQCKKDMARRDAEIEELMEKRNLDRHLERVYATLSGYCWHLEKKLHQLQEPEMYLVCFTDILRREYDATIPADLRAAERSTWW